MNLLGEREEIHYGKFTLKELENYLKESISTQEVKLDFFQSNHEGKIVEYIQQAPTKKVKAFVINAAAFTHTSIAIRDALSSVKIPFIEVHISNIYKRENFRHKSYLNDIALGSIIGLGKEGYRFAIEYFIHCQKESLF